MTMQISTRHDLEFYLSGPATHPAALGYLQSLMDEQYGYDAAGVWTLVGGGGLERLGLTRADAVALGAQDRAVAEPAWPDIAQVKEAACERLNAQRDAIKFGVYTDSHGVRYDVHKDARDSFTGLEAKIAGGLTLPAGFTWTDADNAQQPHTSASISALTTEILFWTTAVHDTCVAAKTAIRSDAVTTAEQVAAIEAGVVWP